MARDERNLKWDNLDQIKFDASAQLCAQSTQTTVQSRAKRVSKNPKHVEK